MVTSFVPGEGGVNYELYLSHNSSDSGLIVARNQQRSSNGLEDIILDSVFTPKFYTREELTEDTCSLILSTLGL
jgi:hypothetical protein